MSKSAFLFIEVLQNSCQLYVKDKKWFLQTEQWYYLGAVRERITSARMHNWFLLNVSVSVWLLCFVLLVQETEMGLPKRHSMLQWLCRKLLSPCNFLETVGLPKILQSECSTTISFAALHIPTLPYTWDVIALYYHIFALSSCTNAVLTLGILPKPWDSWIAYAIWLWISIMLIFMQMTVWSQAAQRGSHHLLCRMMFAYWCWLLSVRLGYFVASYKADAYNCSSA